MSNLKNKVIITAALTGALTPKGYKIPETPDEIAEDAYKCWKAGASVVHIHTRAKDGSVLWLQKIFSKLLRKSELTKIVMLSSTVLLPVPHLHICALMRCVTDIMNFALRLKWVL